MVACNSIAGLGRPPLADVDALAMLSKVLAHNWGESVE
jgi:hypothetical protein